MQFNVCPNGHDLPNWWYGPCLACIPEGTLGTELTMEDWAAAKRQLRSTTTDCEDDEKAEV